LLENIEKLTLSLIIRVYLLGDGMTIEVRMLSNESLPHRKARLLDKNLVFLRKEGAKNMALGYIENIQVKFGEK
jgi:hypothetical protein